MARVGLLGGRSLWLIAPWSALLLCVAGVTMLSSMAALTRERQPEAVIAVDPRDALAQAHYGELLLAQSPGDQRVAHRAHAAAIAALSLDPTRVAAWRTLAATQRDNDRANRLLLVAQWLSRRDPLTQLGLLEYKVQHGDVDGALQHYDNILRVSTVYDGMLFPVLAYAGTDPGVQPALVARLLSSPAWRRRFFSYLANSNTPYRTQATIYTAIAQRGRLPDRDIVALQATNATLSGDYRMGEIFYRLARPDEADIRLRDGSFADLGGVIPYGWMLADDGFLRVATAIAAGHSRLELESPRGDGGRGARQLVQLRPGGHRVQAVIGRIEGETPGVVYATLSCAQGGPMSASAEARADTGHLVIAANVPAGCYPQWLEYGMRQAPSGERVGAWVTSVRTN